MRTRKWLFVLGVLGLSTGAAAMGGLDFGLFRDQQLHAHSEQLFGIVDPLGASSTESVTASTAENDPTSLVTVARHLRVRVVTASANAGPNIGGRCRQAGCPARAHRGRYGRDHPDRDGVLRSRPTHCWRSGVLPDQRGTTSSMAPCSSSRGLTRSLLRRQLSVVGSPGTPWIRRNSSAGTIRTTRPSPSRMVTGAAPSSSTASLGPAGFIGLLPSCCCCRFRCVHQGHGFLPPRFGKTMSQGDSSPSADCCSTCSNPSGRVRHRKSD